MLEDSTFHSCPFKKSQHLFKLLQFTQKQKCGNAKKSKNKKKPKPSLSNKGKI